MFGTNQELRTERIQLMLTPSEVKALEDWRYSHRAPTKSDAVLRLIGLGLKAQAEASKGDGATTEQ